MSGLERRSYVDAGRPVGRKAHHNDLRGPARKDLAAKMDAIFHVLNARDGAVEIEFAAIGRCAIITQAWEIEQQVAESLVCLLVERNTHELALCKLLSLGLLASEKKPSNRFEEAVCAGMSVIVRRTSPHRILVELN